VIYTFFYLVLFLSEESLHRVRYCCYGACSIQSFLPSVTLAPSLFHFPTDNCTIGFSSVETIAIDLKLQYNVQNGFSSRSDIFGNLAWSKIHRL